MECQYCKMIFSHIGNYSAHVTACQKYSKFVQEIPDGYQCTNCGVETVKHRFLLNNHLKICQKNIERGKIDEKVKIMEYEQDNEIEIDEKLSKRVEIPQNTQCEICNYVCATPSNYVQHVQACTYHSKFMRESSEGVQCLLCYYHVPSSVFTNYKYQMYDHIMRQHRKLTNEQKEKMLNNSECDEEIGKSNF